jgi:hypothetical protein
VVGVSQFLAQFPDALDERVIRHGHARPDSLEKLLLGDEPPGARREVAKHLERLGPQADIPITFA